MISKLNRGQPLTNDKINEIIDHINKLPEEAFRLEQLRKHLEIDVQSAYNSVTNTERFLQDFSKQPAGVIDLLKSLVELYNKKPQASAPGKFQEYDGVLYYIYTDETGSEVKQPLYTLPTNIKIEGCNIDENNQYTAFKISSGDGITTIIAPPKGVKGDKGDKGDKGEPGKPGDPLTWDDLTQEQKDSLQGDKGTTGDSVAINPIFTSELGNDYNDFNNPNNAPYLKLTVITTNNESNTKTYENYYLPAQPIVYMPSWDAETKQLTFTRQQDSKEDQLSIDTAAFKGDKGDGISVGLNTIGDVILTGKSTEGQETEITIPLGVKLITNPEDSQTVYAVPASVPGIEDYITLVAWETANGTISTPIPLGINVEVRGTEIIFTSVATDTDGVHFNLLDMVNKTEESAKESDLPMSSKLVLHFIETLSNNIQKINTTIASLSSQISLLSSLTQRVETLEAQLKTLTKE